MSDQPMPIWCTGCWQKYGPLADAEVNGIVFTLALTQRFLEDMHREARKRWAGHPHLWHDGAIRIMRQRGPACCFCAAEMPLMCRAFRSDTMERLSRGRIDTMELLSAYLAKVRAEVN